MKLRGIDFGPVLDASGVRGFFGEGYPFHSIWGPFGLDFTGSTFVAKTMTLASRKGNMHVRQDGTVPWWNIKPSCIAVKPWKGAVLNSVGLSNPGARALFAQGKWQKRQKPFLLSFMATAVTAKARFTELREFLRIFRSHLSEFQAPVGLQINYSCPNAGLHVEELVSEVLEGLSAASDLDIPLMPKFNALFPIDVMAEVAKHRACDALCISNTIPWMQRSDMIDWEGIFHSTRSPLEHLGGGGLSGAPILPVGIDCIMRARAHGIKKAINAGGGILRPSDVDQYIRAGASSVFLGSIAMLRPWRVHKTIARAHECRTAFYGEEEKPWQEI